MAGLFYLPSALCCILTGTQQPLPSTVLNLLSMPQYPVEVSSSLALCPISAGQWGGKPCLFSLFQCEIFSFSSIARTSSGLVFAFCWAYPHGVNLILSYSDWQRHGLPLLPSLFGSLKVFFPKPFFARIKPTFGLSLWHWGGVDHCGLTVGIVLTSVVYHDPWRVNL